MVMLFVEPKFSTHEIYKDKKRIANQSVSWQFEQQLMCPNKCDFKRFSRCPSVKTIAKRTFHLISCILAISQLLERSANSPNGLKPIVSFVGANQDADRLYEDLMMSYNRFVRPVQNDSDTLVVKLGLKLSQLIDVVSSIQVLFLPFSFT